MEPQINLTTVISTIVLLAGYLWGYLRSKAINEAKWEVVASEISAMKHHLQIELSGVKEQLTKMNGNVSANTSWKLHHMEDCHKEKK